MISDEQMTHPIGITRIGCVILGAGAGKRFGEPKAGAMLEPEIRFIDRIAATALAAGIGDIVAVLHPDIKPPQGVRSVFNPNPASEPIASVRLGLAQFAGLPVHGAMLWPVDHPYVLESTVSALARFAMQHTPIIVRPVFEGKHGHPVYFSRDIWRDLVTVKDGGAREIVHRFADEVREIAVEDSGVIRNVDTRGDMVP